MFWWLVRSSDDATKWSRTIKNALPLVISLGAIFGFDMSWLPQGWDFAVEAGAQTTALVTTLTTAYYFFRKVKLTKLGTNQVLNDRIWE